MGEKKNTYQPLTRFALRQSSAFELTASRARLYLAADHLLLLEKTYYKESYRRFYFRDIQALVVEKTNSWRWYTLTWLGFNLLFALILLAAWNSNATYFFLPFLVLSVTGLVVNGIGGQTCKCYLRTAVQYEPLPGMVRLRKTNQLIQRLRPFLLEAQPDAEPVSVASTPATAEPHPAAANPPPA